MESIHESLNETHHHHIQQHLVSRMAEIRKTRAYLKAYSFPYRMGGIDRESDLGQHYEKVLKTIETLELEFLALRRILAFSLIEVEHAMLDPRLFTVDGRPMICVPLDRLRMTVALMYANHEENEKMTEAFHGERIQMEQQISHLKLELEKARVERDQAVKSAAKDKKHLDRLGDELAQIRKIVYETGTAGKKKGVGKGNVVDRVKWVVTEFFKLKGI